MSKCNKIFSCVQTFVMLFLMICNSGSVISNAKKSVAFQCAWHHCGCKSEAYCKTHCCCEFYKNQDKLQNDSNEQNDGFRVFMSSVNCKYGSNPLASVTFTAKYLLENQIQPIKESFMCFLVNDTSITLPDPFVSPPKKPPRPFA